MTHTVRGLKLHSRFHMAPFPYELLQFSPDKDIANYADDNTSSPKVLQDLKKSQIHILDSNGSPKIS